MREFAESFNYDCIVIGGGPAGMMAAYAASSRGLLVCLLEKNNITGRKLRITGKGRCNITNACDKETLMKNIPGNGKFLYSSFSKFSNEDIIRFFNEHGLETVVERGERVFPASNKAVDVSKTLFNACIKNRVDIKCNITVSDLLIQEGKIKGLVTTDNVSFFAENIILATGGITYPLTGSTGDGHKMAQKAGHDIVPLRPSLVPLVSSDKWIPKLQGLSLRNVSIELTDSSGKKVYSDFGEMLFTANGVSGPVILSASRHWHKGKMILHIDLKPAVSAEKLDARVLRDFSEYDRKHFINALADLLPKKLIPVFVSLTGISPDKMVNQITKEERNRIVKLLKDFTINISGTAHSDEGIITAGGINIDQINPRTMESKIVKGLYFAGEMIDVDGYTGGFNLTIAFSTGYTAGANCGIIKKKKGDNQI